MLLVHISDIHFKKDEVGTALDPNAFLRSEILKDAEAMCRGLNRVPDAILLTGDIAFAGDAEEYAFALKWLESLCAKCGAQMQNLFVIPGNHDVVRSEARKPLVQVLHRDIKAASGLSLDALIRGLLQDEDSGSLLYRSIQPYNLFAAQFFCDLLPPNRTIAKRDLTLNDGSILRLLGLNSTFVSSESDREGDLFVDGAALQILREPGVENLVACHHPYSWLRQGRDLEDHLAVVARLHLFGHEHTNRVLLAKNFVRVAASATQPDRREPEWEPGYNLLELNVEGTAQERFLRVKAHVRVWQQRPGGFRAKMDGASDVFCQTIKLDPWTPTAVHSVVPQPAQEDSPTASTPPRLERGVDPMDSLRDISIRFFKLTMSQKSAIAGKLSLFEEEDVNLPDFERFRRVLLRARERNLIGDLDREIRAVHGISA